MPMRFHLLTGAPQTTALWLSISGAMVMAVSAASAQTPATSSSAPSAGVSSTAAPSGTAKKEKKSTDATVDMVNEAIRRSEARAAKKALPGRTETFGSEEPFTYNPALKRFDAK